MDVHRDFCEIAIAECGQVRSAGRIKTRVAELELFAQSLEPDDQVALEATSGAMKVAQLIEPYVGRVVIANTRKLAAISQAKAKTDRLDARTLARLLASGCGLPRGGLAPRRADARPAPADRAPVAARARADARQERDPRRARAQPLRAPAVQRLLRQGRPTSG
jgi:hypothetical protein